MRVLVVAAFLLAVLMTPAAVQALPQASASAQEPPAAARFEVSGSFALNGPRQDGRYTTDFTPPFRFTPHSGSAGHALALAAGRAAGFGGAAAYFPHPRFGVQVIFNRFESDLGGDNEPYRVRVRYTALYPPDYTPREVLFERDYAWPETVGTLTNLSISANAVVRVGDNRSVGVQISGGPTFFRTRGSMQPLGYTELWLGGHSVLFLSEYELEAAIEPETTLGFNAGGEVSVALSRNVALAFDGRYFYAPASASEVRLTRILNLDEIIGPQSIDEIQQQMDPPPVEIDASFFRFAAGLKVRW